MHMYIVLKGGLNATLLGFLMCGRKNDFLNTSKNSP